MKSQITTNSEEKTCFFTDGPISIYYRYEIIDLDFGATETIYYFTKVEMYEAELDLPYSPALTGYFNDEDELINEAIRVMIEELGGKSEI